MMLTIHHWIMVVWEWCICFMAFPWFNQWFTTLEIHPVFWISDHPPFRSATTRLPRIIQDAASRNLAAARKKRRERRQDALKKLWPWIASPKTSKMMKMGSWVDFGSIGLPQRKILKIHWTAANKVSGIHQQPTPFQPAGCCLKLWYPKIGWSKENYHQNL